MTERLNWYSTAIEALRGADLTGKTALVTGGAAFRAFCSCRCSGQPC